MLPHKHKFICYVNLKKSEGGIEIITARSKIKTSNFIPENAIHSCELLRRKPLSLSKKNFTEDCQAKYFTS